MRCAQQKLVTIIISSGIGAADLQLLLKEATIHIFSSQLTSSAERMISECSIFRLDMFEATVSKYCENLNSVQQSPSLIVFDKSTVAK